MERKKVENTYITHPAYKDQFRPQPVREILREVLTAKLGTLRTAV